MRESVRRLDRKRCTGCGSCVAICPNKAISTKFISEGFYYPFVDGYICDFCGTCSSYCPLLTENLTWDCTAEEEYSIKRYAFAASDEIRWDCEDGGAKQVVIDFVLNRGGKICAPLFTKDFRGTVYDIMEKPEECKGRTLVKYVECDASAVFPKVEKILKSGNVLLFLGVPCQNAGLKRYLGRKYENLLLGDILCKGVTSQEVWSKYLDMVSEGETVQNVYFGAKELGWGESIRVKYGKDKIKNYDGLINDIFIQAYRRGLSLRKCCFSCAYGEPQGDLGFDVFYEVNKYNAKLDDKRGMSYLAAYTTKAEPVLEGISEKCQIFKEIGNAVLEGPPNIKCSEEQRLTFFECLETQGWKNVLRNIESCSVKKTIIMSVYALDYHMGDTVKWKICNKAVWQRKNFDGYDVLFTDGNTSGSWILMPMTFALEIGTEYKFDIRFKGQTKTRNVRMLLTDKVPDGGKPASIIEIWGQNIPNNTWIRAKGSYIPKKAGLKYFYLTSTDFTGEGSYVCLDWIRIWQK